MCGYCGTIVTSREETSDMEQVTRENSKAAYKKLLAFQKADQLVHGIYNLSVHFPKEEVFSFTSQIRRSALSVTANIIEGHARNSKNEFRHFLSVALGSLTETEYYLEFAFKRKWISIKQYEEIESLRSECGKLLWKLYKSQ